MYYAVIHRPDIDIAEIQAIRSQYDPTFSLINPHVTLVFPLPEKGIKLDALIEKVSQVAQSSQPFSVHMSELELSWDQWLFLTPTKGRSEFDDLHDRLYEGLLQPFLRADIPYAPHIGLGQFTQDGSDYTLKDPTAVPLNEELYKKARAEIDEQNLAYDYTTKTIEIVSIDDGYTHSETVREFKLG